MPNLSDAQALWLLGVAASLVTARAGTWYGARRARVEIASTEAGSAQQLVDTALKLLEPYERRIQQLEELERSREERETERRQSVVRMHQRIDDLERHLESLEEHIRSNGGDPPPRPAHLHRTITPEEHHD